MDEVMASRPAGLTIHLLGRPRLERADKDSYRFRSRKSWAVLAYLVLAGRPPSRSQLASLLFAEADDPLRALRWALAEIRRGLDDDGSLDGDPLVLELADDVVVDVQVAAHGSWADAVQLPGLGGELLDGHAVNGAGAFESWLLSERRRLLAASEAVLHEAALGAMSAGLLDAARAYAVRAVAMSPLDENHQALLIRLYRLAGDDDAAEQQYAALRLVLDADVGVAPGPAVEEAMRERRSPLEPATDDASIEAIVESGAAAVSAGAVDAAVHSLRTAVRLADGRHRDDLRIHSRLLLAQALVHALRGLDEEGLANLHEADRIAVDTGDRRSVAEARAELGYVDFLRARYDRAELWLTDALTWADDSPQTQAKAMTYLGCVASDRADYPRAIVLLLEATRLSRAARDPRREAYGLSLLGRLNLLCGDLDSASRQLDASMDLAEREHWLSFLPWPQALRGEVHLADGDPVAASQVLSQAFARACRLGDPCWEGLSARGLALVADASGHPDRAFALLADARARCNRFADPYVWLDVYILDALCHLGRRHRHPQTRLWVDTMRERASRTGMSELTVRSMLHAADGGHRGDAAAAALLGADIDNPVLQDLLSG